MVFSSAIFLICFLPVTLLLYYLADRKYKNYILLISSIIFYSWGAPKFVFILLASTFLDFYIVKCLYQAKTKKRKNLFLFLSIFINLGLLLYFKYANFFIENVNMILNQYGIENIKWTEIILPIGISFYTFQTLTYSIDVYRNVHKPLTKVFDYIMSIEDDNALVSMGVDSGWGVDVDSEVARALGSLKYGVKVSLLDELKKKTKNRVCKSKINGSSKLVFS